MVVDCVRYVREALGSLVVEVRLDSAFFQEKLLDELHGLDVEFSASVPFERFPELKTILLNTRDWQRINDVWSFREICLRPKSWTASTRYRIVLYRRRSLVQRKGPLQLDLFEPRDTQFEYLQFVWLIFGRCGLVCYARTPASRDVGVQRWIVRRDRVWYQNKIRSGRLV